jgi:uroporphyrinogen decarboxylase
MRNMTSKEVILNAINLKPTDRVPVALLSGGAWALNRNGLSLKAALSEGAEKSAQILAEAYEKSGSDIAWVGSGYHNLAIGAIGGKIKYREKGTPDVIEALINNSAEVDDIDLTAVSKDEDINTLYQTGKSLIKYVGSNKIVGVSQWGPFTLAGLLYSAENIMRGIYKDKEGVHKVLEFSTNLYLSYITPFVDAGINIVSIADPSASGDMISREQFENFSLPYLKKVVQKLKSKGVIVLIHICGNTTNRLDLIPQTGADIISVDYKVNLSTARNLVGGKIAFSGNMNPVNIMLNSSPADVEVACRTCIEKAGNSGGYILMPGCDIPPSVPLENIQAMVKVAHEYKNRS